jgi:hypothetical protein
MAVSRLCSIPDCGKPVRSLGLCGSHYFRQRRHGDPLAGSTSKGEAERFFRETVLAYDGNDCLYWPYARLPSGYAKMKGHNVHRRICEEAHGPAPTAGHEAAHSCGGGKHGCVTKRHLSWKTHLENEADKLLHGTRPRGETQGSSKLTEDDVRTIRSSIEKGIDLATRYGVSAAHISYLRSGKKWSWLLPHQSAEP